MVSRDICQRSAVSRKQCIYLVTVRISMGQIVRFAVNIAILCKEW